MNIKIQLYKPKCIPDGALFWASSHPHQTSLMDVLHELDSSSSNTRIKQPKKSILRILVQMGILGLERNGLTCRKQFPGEEFFLGESPIPIK
jgi:hypothetical protein